MSVQHEIFEEQLALAVAGELPEAEQAALDKHLAACQPCRERVPQWVDVELQLCQWSAEAYRSAAWPRGMRTRFGRRLGAADVFASPLRVRGERPRLRMAALGAVVLLSFCVYLRYFGFVPPQAESNPTKVVETSAIAPQAMPALRQVDDREQPVRKPHIPAHGQLQHHTSAQDRYLPPMMHFVYRGESYRPGPAGFREAIAMPVASVDRVPDFASIRWNVPDGLVTGAFEEHRVAFDISNFHYLPGSEPGFLDSR